MSLWIFIKLLKNGFSLKIFISNLHSWCDRIVVLGFSVLFFSQFEWKVIQSSHNLVNPSLWNLSLRISHIWRFWVLEDLESSAKKILWKYFLSFWNSQYSVLSFRVLTLVILSFVVKSLMSCIALVRTASFVLYS